MTNQLTSFRSFLAALALVATVGVSGACSGGGGPACDKVVDHVSQITGMKLEGDRRTGAIDKCKKAPASARSCMLKASAVEDLAACAKK
ncbi:MAG: hypothetical protein R3B06_17210 [Kofleriaceae bacterium]